MADSDRGDLMEFLTGQFAEIARRFDHVDGQIAALYEHTDVGFAAVDRRFDAVDGQIAALYQHMESRFTAVDRRFDTVDERFGEMLGHLDEIYRRLERLEQEYLVMSEQLRRIGAPTADESGRRDRLERDLAALRERIVILQARVAEIERRLGL